MWTDPQIHTPDGDGFGEGNMGQDGIDSFLSTHWCNALCACLGLPRCVPEACFLSCHKMSGTVAHRSLSAAHPDLPPFCVRDYLGPVKPVKNGISETDLALLGITPEQFWNIAQLFAAMDKEDVGRLRTDALCRVMDKTNVFAHASLCDDVLLLMGHLEDRTDDEGCITFVDFLCCWTGNV